MKSFALACTAAIAIGLGVDDAQHPPHDVDVRSLLIFIFKTFNPLPLACQLQDSKQVWLHVAIRHELPPLRLLRSERLLQAAVDLDEDHRRQHTRLVL